MTTLSNVQRYPRSLTNLLFRQSKNRNKLNQRRLDVILPPENDINWKKDIVTATNTPTKSVDESVYEETLETHTGRKEPQETHDTCSPKNRQRT